MPPQLIKRAARRASLSAVGGCLAALAFAGVAQAETVTVGAVLTGPQIIEGHCTAGSGCGFLTIDAGPPASGAVATADGTVTSWSVLGAAALRGYSANVVRKNPNGTYTVTESSAEVTPAESVSVQTFATNLPIHAGEFVELNVPDGGTISVLEGSSHAEYFLPELAFGEIRSGFPLQSVGEEPSVVVGYSADIEYSSLVPAVIPLPTTTTGPETTGGSGTTANGVTVAPAPVAASCVIPKLTGKKLKVAKKLVRAAGCKVGLISHGKGVKSATGKVAKQSPSAGKSVPAHTAVSFKLV